jgi:hypothetical protein
MPITKQHILKSVYDEVRTVEVIPSGMTLTVKATLKNPNYGLETVQDVTFTAPTADQQVRVYLVNALDPIEVLYNNAEPTEELVMDICSFTLKSTATDLTNEDITVLEVI